MGHYFLDRQYVEMRERIVVEQGQTVHKNSERWRERCRQTGKQKSKQTNTTADISAWQTKPIAWKETENRKEIIFNIMNEKY